MFECAIKPLLNLYRWQLAAPLLLPLLYGPRCPEDYGMKTSGWKCFLEARCQKKSPLTESRLYVLSLCVADVNTPAPFPSELLESCTPGFLSFYRRYNVSPGNTDAHLCFLEFCCVVPLIFVPGSWLPLIFFSRMVCRPTLKVSVMSVMLEDLMR